MVSFALKSVVLLASLVSANPFAKRQVANPTAVIASGTVVGTATRVSNQPSVTGLVNAYLGVPFAKPPTGTLRFASPTAPTAFATPFQARTQPPACLQQFLSGDDGARERKYFNNPGYAQPPESEDCLYLNVFAPRAASPTNLKPVMFWLYGGNLQIGAASLVYYNGSSLAVNQDVVVVVPNYRSNIFGFSNSPQITFGQQNSGFLDQRYALQWVQQNIKAFGGDPTKVTIFGESAGGYSVKQLLANPPSPLPFQAAIMESQQAALPGSGSDSYNKVLQNFGCSVNFSPIDCLRKVPATSIQTYIVNNNLIFPPVLNDGTYVASNSLPSLQSGKFANVPVYIGTNKDESRVFLAILGIMSGDNVNVIDTVFQQSGYNISGIYSQLLQNYTSSITNVPYLFAAQVLTDLLFTCTTRSFSNAIAATGRPVWRYRYDGDFPNVSFFPNAGATHITEIPEAWGTYPLVNYLGAATATQIKLSAYMQGVWAGFAKNPSGGVPWPRLGSAFGVELGILGGSDAPNSESTKSLFYADYPCPIYDPLLAAAKQQY